MSFPSPVELCRELGSPHGNESTDAIEFCPQHFARWWPQDCPLPTVLHSDGWNSRARITRGQLFALGRRASTAEDAVKFFAATAAYGSGTQARSVYRACRAPAVSGFGEVLADLIDRGRGLTAAESFALWHSAVPFVGPSTFTKLAYFSQPEWSLETADKPMILDGRILRALNCAGAAISSRLYSEYLDLLAMTAALAGWSESAVERRWTHMGLKLLGTPTSHTVCAPALLL